MISATENLNKALYDLKKRISSQLNKKTELFEDWVNDEKNEHILMAIDSKKVIKKIKEEFSKWMESKKTQQTELETRMEKEMGIQVDHFLVSA